MRPARAFVWSLDDIETCLAAVREEMTSGPTSSESLRLAMELRLGVTLDEDLFDGGDIASKILTRIQP